MGRLPENENPLSDGHLSRRHFQIIHDGISYYLRDVRSANGTYLNERKLDSDSVLINGDIIRVGKTRLKFISGKDPARGELDDGHHPAKTDALTGCHTKHVLNTHLNRAFRKAATEEIPLSLLLFTFDAIEGIASQYGEQIQDVLLVRGIHRIHNIGTQEDPSPGPLFGARIRSVAGRIIHPGGPADRGPLAGPVP
ncbi:MAG: FHA domain-containing protein [Gammaproteobacteria bacterium]|nr:FHA domain-containing protein [Gammaproteobacteria bacterium]MBU1656340.1 FHA domain-containing protein [Gammaproteobacteria bacterium]MBU1959905.1 FHA domain-containing protein [Gammaproteobacteria bacterium]